MPPVGFFLPGSLIEWPGKITASVVLQGCNFRCPFCHSKEFIPVGRPKDEVPLDDILTELSARRHWIDGVVISGGEPTIHADLPEFVSRFRELGLFVKLDTNGSNPAMLEGLLDGDAVDLVAVDIKAPLGRAYAEAAGGEVSTEAVGHSLELLLSHLEKAEFRTTVVPGMHTPEMIEDIARLISGAPLYYIQNFEPHNTLDPEMEQRKPFGPEDLETFVSVAAKHVGCAVVRGTDIAKGTKCRTYQQMGLV